MAKTDFEKIMWPMLKLAESNEISLSDAEEKLAKQFKLTPTQKNKLKKSGSETVLRNRIGWARMYLKHAGLVTYPKPGYYQLTKTGKQLTKKKLESIDTNYLIENYPKFANYQKRVNQAKKLAQQERKSKSIKKQKGFVIFLDALGTKGIWKNEKENTRIINSWTKYTQNFNKEMSKIKARNISFMTFSDTIIITIQPYNVQKTLLEISPILSSAIIDSMILERPIRGSISFGDYYPGKDSIIGEAIDEAVEYNILPQWIGISAAPSAHKILEDMKLDSLENLYQKYDIPTKSLLEQDGWAVNWTSTSDTYVQNRKFEKHNFKNTKELLQFNIKKIKNIAASIKWRNTQKFFYTES